MRSNRLLIIYILLAVFALSTCSSDNDTTDGDTSDGDIGSCGIYCEDRIVHICENKDDENGIAYKDWSTKDCGAKYCNISKTDESGAYCQYTGEKEDGYGNNWSSCEIKENPCEHLVIVFDISSYGFITRNNRLAIFNDGSYWLLYKYAEDGRLKDFENMDSELDFSKCDNETWYGDIYSSMIYKGSIKISRIDQLISDLYSTMPIHQCFYLSGGMEDGGSFNVNIWTDKWSSTIGWSNYRPDPFIDTQNILQDFYDDLLKFHQEEND